MSDTSKERCEAVIFSLPRATWPNEAREAADLITALRERVEEMERERDGYALALAKIARWDVSFPEHAKDYGPTALVTAREAVSAFRARSIISKHGVSNAD